MNYNFYVNSLENKLQIFLFQISYKKAQNLSYRYIIVDVLFIVDFHMLEKEIPAHGTYTTKIFSNIDSSYKSLLTLTQKIYSTF